MFLAAVIVSLQASAAVPSPAEFHSHVLTASRGMIVRCLTVTFNMFMAGMPLEARRKQLDTLVARTVAVVEECEVGKAAR